MENLLNIIFFLMWIIIRLAERIYKLPSLSKKYFSSLDDHLLQLFLNSLIES